VESARHLHGDGVPAWEPWMGSTITWVEARRHSLYIFKNGSCLNWGSCRTKKL